MIPRPKKRSSTCPFDICTLSIRVAVTNKGDRRRPIQAWISIHLRLAGCRNGINELTVLHPKCQILCFWNQGSTLSFLAGCPKSHFLGWYRNFLVQCKPDISRLVGSMERYRNISESAIYRATVMSQIQTPVSSTLWTIMGPLCV